MTGSLPGNLPGDLSGSLPGVLPGAGAEPYILFTVADTHYAVPAAQVQIVEMLETVTRVPNTPDFLDGIVFVRGQVVPVINLRRRFHLPALPYDLRTRMIVIQLAERRIGMVVDSAREFVYMDPAQIQPPPDGLVGPGREYLQGVIHLDQRLVLLVNLPEILQPKELQQLEQIDAPGNIEPPAAQKALE